MKIVLVLLEFFSISFHAFNQNCSKKQENCKKIIKINFNDRTTFSNPNDLKLHRGDIYNVVIENINLNVYNVSISGRDTTLSQAIDFTKMNLGSISSMLTSIKTFAESTIKYDNSILDTSMLTPTNFKDTISEFLKNSIIDNEATKTKNNEFETEFSRWKTKILKTSLFEKTEILTAQDLNSFSKFYNDFRNDLIINSKTINDKSDLYLKFSQDNSKKIIAQKVTKEDSQIKAINAENLKNIDSTLQLVPLSIHDSIISLMIDLINNSSKTYTSLPLQFTKEQTKLKIVITPHDSTSRLPSYSTEYLIPTDNRFYIGIGPGFYYSKLTGSAYSIKGTASTDTSYRLVEEQSSKGEIGVSLLLKAGCKIGKNQIVGLHLSGGTGFSFTNPIQPRLMYGLGASIGDRHRLTVDLGGISGYVNVLSNSYALETNYSIKPESMVVSKMKTSGFLSVGYIYVF